MVVKRNFNLVKELKNRNLKPKEKVKYSLSNFDPITCKKAKKD